MEEKDESINELMNNKGVCRTAPATPDLLRETVPLLTSDMGKKTLSVLAH